MRAFSEKYVVLNVTIIAVTTSTNASTGKVTTTASNVTPASASDVTSATNVGKRKRKLLKTDTTKNVAKKAKSGINSS